MLNVVEAKMGLIAMPADFLVGTLACHIGGYPGIKLKLDMG